MAPTAIWFIRSDGHCLVVSCALITDPGRFERDLLQAIAIGDDAHQAFQEFGHLAADQCAQRLADIGAMPAGCRATMCCAARTA